MFIRSLTLFLYHISQVEPLIEKANLGLVHHVVLYGCYDDVDREHYFKKNKTGFDCINTANMPPDVNSCRTSIFAWGVGGGVSISHLTMFIIDNNFRCVTDIYELPKLYQLLLRNDNKHRRRRRYIA